jgi:FAD:protein FMN transferase
MSETVYRRTIPVMGTLVTIDVVDRSAPKAPVQLAAAVERAFAWFYQIEECCTRFDPQSELVRLTAHVGVTVPVSAILYQAVRFALAVAEESGGAFDPTVGSEMEMRGFDREYRSGRAVRCAPGRGGLATFSKMGRPTYRDVRLDPDRKTITLLRPLLLDLGAVAKGLAIDMAARELRLFAHFAINAGGDVYVGGHNAQGAPWSVGIRHPRVPDALFDTLRVSDCAVCTSGDYERRCSAETEGEADGHHILDPREARFANSSSARASASVTVIAPSAMLADALATAAFVLGPEDGIALLERLGVDGLIISPALERHATRGICSDNHELSGATILPDAQGPSADRPGGSDRPGRAN